MSYKSEKLAEIINKVSQMYHSGAIDSLKVEVVAGDSREILYTDSTVLSLPELNSEIHRQARLCEKPKLTLVRG